MHGSACMASDLVTPVCQNSCQLMDLSDPHPQTTRHCQLTGPLVQYNFSFKNSFFFFKCFPVKECIHQSCM